MPDAGSSLPPPALAVASGPGRVRTEPESPSAWPAARVALLTGRDEFALLARQWDALVERCDDQTFYRHRFLQLWLEHFAAGAELRVLTLFDAAGRLSAALPLVAMQSTLYGLPMREWRAPANDHSCRFDWLADDPPRAARTFVAYLQRRDDWDLLRLIDVPEVGRGQVLIDAAANAGLGCGCWAGQESPYVLLPSNWSDYERRLKRHFRAGLRRRRRRLDALGQVSVERVTGGPGLLDRLEEGLALELDGWKGRAGTAIRQDPATHAFYRALAEHAAEEHRLALWFVRLDGRAVAFEFALEHGDRVLLLKTAYDEHVGRCSPGQLLVEVELRDAIARGMRECDMLGTSTPAKLDWTDRVRRHSWLYLFRGPRGRLAQALKFHVAPIVKRFRRSPAETGDDDGAAAAAH